MQTICKCGHDAQEHIGGGQCSYNDAATKADCACGEFRPAMPSEIPQWCREAAADIEYDDVRDATLNREASIAITAAIIARHAPPEAEWRAVLKSCADQLWCEETGSTFPCHLMRKVFLEKCNCPGCALYRAAVKLLESKP